MSRVRVISEAGVNHNGSLDLARRLVDAAAEAGADAVKFQTFRADRLVTSAAPKARYQVTADDPGATQHAMLQALELDEPAHRGLIEHARSRGIAFLSTPFDLESLALLTGPLGLAELKVGSGELTNAPFLLAIARTGRPVILSTGMGNLAEVEQALGVLAFGYLEAPEPAGPAAFADAYASDAGQEMLRRRVSLLHCTSSYPAPIDAVNLRAMDTLGQAFGLPVGYSDHTLGITVAIAAAARGATIIEKHLTLDRSLPGPDHRASLEPPDFAAMVAGIRDVEQALGTARKVPHGVERDTARVARGTLVASRPIAAGERFSAENLSVKRAGTGIPPIRYWDCLGRTAPRPFAIDEAVEW